MPLPFDMLAVMLFLSYYTETAAEKPPGSVIAFGIVAAAVVVMGLVAAAVNWVAVRKLIRPGMARSSRRAVVGWAEGIIRIVLVILYMLSLEESSLPWSLAKTWNLSTRPESFLIQLFGLFPYLLLFFAAWLPMYPFHKTSSPGLWTRKSYILNKARYNLYILLAWIPFAFLADWLGEFIVILPVLFLFAAWSFPVLLARVWGCRTLPEGEAMDSVRQMEKKAGVSFSRVYLWEPGGGTVQNAAAVGVLPPFRYLFLTPALIRAMTRTELEAVILHELGHAKKKHLIFYLFTSLAGINTAVIAGFLLPASPGERFVITSALVLFYFRFIFGWLSRNMERQADLFALEKSGSAKGLINALEKLGIAAGNIRLASSWHHLGIAERVDFLRRAERHPVLAATHNAGVSQLMLMGYLLSVAVIAGMVWLAYDEYSSVNPLPLRSQEVMEREERSHWRRVLLLMPGDPAAHLELAYALAKSPEYRSEAVKQAAQALKLSTDGEVHDAAASLLQDLDD